MVPLFEPLGFGDWRAVMSLLVGFVAKEAVVSAIEILYTPEDFAALFTPVTAFAFMVFTLLYLPCLAAFATIKRELSSWKLAIFAAAYQTAIAYAAAFIVYRIGLLAVQHLS
jgi:ferrous iron transport protein B